MNHRRNTDALRVFAFSLMLAAAPAFAQEEANPGDGWHASGQAELEQRLEQPRREGRAKNVIVFIVDGMSLGTVVAARILDGQNRGEPGEENYLPFERWGHSALVKTYAENAQVADSAATATAIHTGVKTHYGAISVYARHTLESCGPEGIFPETLVERAEQRGLSTGIVSTARLTHATPAAAYAHLPHRGWESDRDLYPEAVEAGCRDLARQFVEFDHGDGIDVALAGGWQAFRTEKQGGRRRDGRDLIAEWVEAGGVHVEDVAGFRELDAEEDAPVLGLFTPSHMAYEHDRDNDSEPSLAEMTRFAIERLSRNEHGYYLLVEAGRVDHGHHAANAYRALTDMLAFSEAVEQAVNMVDLDETLVLVTSDHANVFTISGYPRRGNPILGLVHPPDYYFSGEPTPPSLAGDGRPYTTLGYYTGPHQRPHGPDARALTQEQALDPDYRQEAAVPMDNETHSGEDVPAYAIGPWAHLVSGVMEQHTLFHIITHAYGWDREG